MTSLIVDHAGGRCDSRCHEAMLPGCDCICGGSLHGAGSSTAAQARLQQLVAGGMLGERPAMVVRDLWEHVEMVEVHVAHGTGVSAEEVDASSEAEVVPPHDAGAVVEPGAQGGAPPAPNRGGDADCEQRAGEVGTGAAVREVRTSAHFGGAVNAGPARNTHTPGRQIAVVPAGENPASAHLCSSCHTYQPYQGDLCLVCLGRATPEEMCGCLKFKARWTSAGHLCARCRGVAS